MRVTKESFGIMVLNLSPEPVITAASPSAGDDLNGPAMAEG
jgi:hypothetical protein